MPPKTRSALIDAVKAWMMAYRQEPLPSLLRDKTASDLAEAAGGYFGAAADTTLTPELMAHISRRNGEMTALLARHREVEAQIATLATETATTISISVHPVGKHFQMMVPVATLRAQHEAMLATLAERILERAGVPMDDMPPAEPEPEPEPAPATLPSASNEGTATNV